MRVARWALAAAAVLYLGTGARASTVLGLTIEDQARLSSDVVVGEVLSLQGVEDPENGIETEVTLRVTFSLKGGTRPGDSLVFHTRSGEVDGVISQAVGEADLKPGQRILAFVEEIDGRKYNLGLSFGVFNALEDRKGKLSFVRALQDGLEIVGEEEIGNGPFALEEIASRVAFARRNPRFDNGMVREVFGTGR